MLKKNKIIMSIFIVVSILLLFVALFIFVLIKDDYKAMNYEDFVDFKTEEIVKNNRNYLLISGQYNGSSLKIKEIKEEIDNSDNILRVYTTLFSKNDSAFLYSIELKESINRVLFGDEKKVIWERIKKGKK